MPEDAFFDRVLKKTRSDACSARSRTARKVRTNRAKTCLRNGVAAPFPISGAYTRGFHSLVVFYRQRYRDARQRVNTKKSDTADRINTKRRAEFSARLYYCRAGESLPWFVPSGGVWNYLILETAFTRDGGMRTESITWITPLSQTMSVLTTRALLI